MDRALERYHQLMKKENTSLLAEDPAGEVDAILKAADQKLVQK
jgi:hypothetical protein